MTNYYDAFKKIPGTVIFDATQSRIGYHLNMFAMSLMKEISTEEDQFIQQMKAKHDREYRAFKLTPLAIAMFSPVLVQGSKHGTYRNAANTVH